MLALADNDPAWLLLPVFAILGPILYFLPTIIACARAKKNALWIAILNVWLGPTVIGWIAALFWSLFPEKRS